MEVALQPSQDGADRTTWALSASLPDLWASVEADRQQLEAFTAALSALSDSYVVGNVSALTLTATAIDGGSPPLRSPPTSRTPVLPRQSPNPRAFSTDTTASEAVAPDWRPPKLGSNWLDDPDDHGTESEPDSDRSSADSLSPKAPHGGAAPPSVRFAAEEGLSEGFDDATLVEGATESFVTAPVPPSARAPRHRGSFMDEGVSEISVMPSEGVTEDMRHTLSYASWAPSEQ